MSVEHSLPISSARRRWTFLGALFRLFQLLQAEALAWLLLCVSSLPDSPFGNLCRRWFWRQRLGAFGLGSMVSRASLLGVPKDIFIGNDVSISNDCAISAAQSRGVFIGDQVMIARGTYIHAGDHQTNDTEVPMAQQGYCAAEITFQGRSYSVVVEEGVWIGSNSVLVSGAHIGRHALIAPGSVVRGEIPAFAVAMGNPAKVIRFRNDR